MLVTAIRTPLVHPGDDLERMLQELLPRPLQERDIVCVTSKVISMSQGRLVDLSTIEPSPRAVAMQRRTRSADLHDSPEMIELILRESDRVFGLGVVWLTLKDGIFVANGGIDLSNAPPGHAILWPERPWSWAHDFWERLREVSGLRELGVVVTDSRCVPLRRGVTGVAMAYCGIEGMESQKGKLDLFGHPLAFTEKAVADDLATVAVLVGGEAAESTPFILIEGAPAKFTDEPPNPASVMIDPGIDMFESIYSEDFKKLIDASGKIGRESSGQTGPSMV